MGLTGTMARRALTMVGVAALALPLAACGVAPGAPLLERAGCPADIRIQTDDLPNVPWAFLYSLLGDDLRFRIAGRQVSGPLEIDGVDSGVRLTILSGDPADGVSANVALHEDPSLLLGAVDTDVALLDVKRYPTVGVFAPTARDTRIVYWNADVYPGVRNVEGLGDTLTPDGTQLAPIHGDPADPFVLDQVASLILGAEQVVASEEDSSVASYLAGGGIAAQIGDLLVDPYVIAQLPDAAPIGFQPVDEAGFPRDRVLAAAPQTMVRYADCLRVLIPVFQQALVDYMADPEPTIALLARIASEYGIEDLDADLLTAAHEVLVDRRIVSNGRDDTIGDLDFGRLRDLRADLATTWARLDRAFPDVPVEQVVTNDFIDRSIGL